MRRATLLFLFSLSLLVGPAFALQGKSTAPGQVKKKAHADISKWVKAKKRSLKVEIKFYDDLVGFGVSPSEALKTVKVVVEHNLNLAKLGHSVRRRTHAGIRGKVLSEAIHREVKARAEEKKKAKAKKAAPGHSKGKKKGKSGK